MTATSLRAIPIEQLKILISKQLSLLNYSENSICGYLCYANTIQKYMERAGFELYTEEVGNLWLDDCRKNPIKESTLTRYHQIIERFNDILNENDIAIRRSKVKYEAPEEFSEVFQAYLHSRQTKNQAAGTILNKRRNGSYFFSSLPKLGCHSIGEITSEIISKVSIMHTTSVYYTTLRDILSFLLEKGMITADYTPLVPKIHRGMPAPSVYTKEELHKIENMPDFSTSMGKRDRAMILLSTRNGFRAGNIAALKLEDIDYQNGIIHIDNQVKTRYPINSALLPDVKTAILDYINNGRPDTDSPYIFIKTSPPYDEVNSDIVYNVVSKYIRKSSIDPNGRKIGPHAMRSSLTSAGINNGMTYEEMRVIIGHKSAEAIKHYAKLDDTELRKCAMTVCKPSGLFSRFLDGKEVCPSL